MFKNCLSIIFLLSIIISGSPTFGQEINGSEKDHEALRNLKTVYENAVNTNNLTLIEPYLDKRFSIVTFTNKEFTNFDAFKKQWNITRKTMLNGGTYKVELLPDRSMIIDDFAITKGNSNNFIITGKGDEYNFTAYWTAVCQKINGEWKIIRAHNSLNPFDNPVVKDGFKKVLVKTSIAILFLGFIVGWITRKLYLNKKHSTA